MKSFKILVCASILALSVGMVYGQTGSRSYRTYSRTGQPTGRIEVNRSGSTIRTYGNTGRPQQTFRQSGRSYNVYGPTGRPQGSIRR